MAVSLAVLIPAKNLVIAVKVEAGILIQGGAEDPLINPMVLGDVVLNVVGYVPLALLLSLGWPRVRPWAWASLCLLVSLTTEAIQMLPILNRRADVLNVVENGLGAFIGAWIAIRIQRRSAAPATAPIPAENPDSLSMNQ